MKIISFLPSRIRTVRRSWNSALLILFSVCITAPLQAQTSPPEPPPASQQNAPQRLAPEELDRLLAPIALYPDALIALILPASTVPSDLVLAARFIASNGDPAQIANQPWDDSVKSLARYPDVLKWMDQNLDWTTTVGDVFLDQPADVMNSVQRLRAEALAAGNLNDTPQQQIIKEESHIRIVPAQPEVIYVPEYDPEVVYVQRYSQDFGPPLTFGVGFAVGSWLNYDCDWDRRGIYVGHWRPGWKRDRDWDRGDHDPKWDRRDRGREWDRGDRGPNNTIVNVVNIESDTARQWRPSANSQRRQAQQQRSNRANARFSNDDPQDVDRESGEPPTPGLAGAAETRINQMPKPSRLDVGRQGRERTRRDSQASDGSSPPDGFPATSDAPTDATPGAPGKNKKEKVPDPATSPDVADEQGTPAPGGGQESDARNLSKRGQGRAKDNAGATDATSEARGKDRKVPEPTNAPNVAGEQDAPAQDGGQKSDSRNLSKRERGPAKDNAGATDATSGARDKDRKIPEPTNAPNVAGEQGAPAQNGGQKSDDRNLSKRERGPAKDSARGTNGAADARDKNRKISSPPATATASGEQGKPSANGQGSASRNVKKQAQDGSNSQPPAAPRIESAPKQEQKKQIDQSQSEARQSSNSERRSNERKREQKPDSQSAADKPSQQQPAAARDDQQPKRSAAPTRQDTPSQPSKAPQGKDKGKGGGEKSDDKKNKDGN
jgi:hypothetical protein